MVSLVILQVFNNNNNNNNCNVTCAQTDVASEVKKNAPLRNAKNERNEEKANDVKT